jgi:8-oxo-dGTP diphosphatase
MIQSTAATVLLRRPNGDFLMQLRDDGRGKLIPYPNMWNFPGGAVEPNEEPLNAAIREIEEEFEIKLQPSDCRELWRYTHDHAAIDHFFCVRLLQTLCPCCMKARLGHG